MRNDPHSHADLDQGRCVALALDWEVDFERQVLRGTATLTLDAPKAGPLDLDTRGLAVEGVVDGDGAALPFELVGDDPILGPCLRIERAHPMGEVTVTYATSPEATALMWLDPSQTHGGEHPFVLSQCQAIHARSLAPLQDSPRVRAPYTARLTIPASLSAVMSAAPGEESVAEDGRKVVTFEMPQPIPSYLIAIAVGDIDHRDLGPRTRVYAEPGVVEAAAWEFADAESMLETAEALFGPYAWDRYDFIVLPPSFPFGGMENPRMTFLTPTLLAGDRSLVSVLAHELAHSWTGNLVTNATNEDFWLNEGWTVYAERRILEKLLGAERAAQEARLGRVSLEETIEERRAEGRSTALTYPQAGTDPDAEFSKVPYEKGFLLITALERAVGRAAFDAFIQRYMARFRFQSITTDEFVAFVRAKLPEAAAKVDLETWLRKEGIPEGAAVFQSERLTELARLAEGWTPEQAPSTEGWSTTETLFFLSQLPPLDAAQTAALGDWLGLRTTGNAELTCEWLRRAASAGVDGVEDELRRHVDRVGRTKLLKPVLAAMVQNPELKPLAEALVEANRPRFHASTRLALDSLVG